MYGSSKDPAQFGSLEAILENNYRLQWALFRQGEAGQPNPARAAQLVEENRRFVDPNSCRWCIPVMAAREAVYDVHKRATPASFLFPELYPTDPDFPTGYKGYRPTRSRYRANDMLACLARGLWYLFFSQLALQWLLQIVRLIVCSRARLPPVPPFCSFAFYKGWLLYPCRTTPETTTRCLASWRRGSRREKFLG